MGVHCVTCPACARLDDVTHALDIYDLMPLKVLEDGDLMLRAGICFRRGVTVYQSVEGWTIETGNENHEFFGSYVDVEDKE